MFIIRIISIKDIRIKKSQVAKRAEREKVESVTEKLSGSKAKCRPQKLLCCSSSYYLSHYFLHIFFLTRSLPFLFFCAGWMYFKFIKNYNALKKFAHLCLI